MSGVGNGSMMYKCRARIATEKCHLSAPPRKTAPKDIIERAQSPLFYHMNIYIYIYIYAFRSNNVTLSHCVYMRSEKLLRSVRSIDRKTRQTHSPPSHTYNIMYDIHRYTIVVVVVTNGFMVSNCCKYYYKK